MNATPRVLIIDDNRAWLEALADYLRNKGFAVLTATDGAEGLALLESNEATLIVCDYHMPRMDGLELLRSLRQRQRNIAVLMMSSEEEPTLASRARAEGARDFLAKSTAPWLLVRKLRQIVGAVQSFVSGASELQPWQRLLPGPKRTEPRVGRPSTVLFLPKPRTPPRRPA